MARIRITIDCDEAHRRAFLAWASLEGLSPQELFQKLVADHCPAEIMDRARKSAGADDDPPKKGKRGQ